MESEQPEPTESPYGSCSPTCLHGALNVLDGSCMPLAFGQFFLLPPFFIFVLNTNADAVQVSIFVTFWLGFSLFLKVFNMSLQATAKVEI
jgi:hypothetical protein